MNVSPRLHAATQRYRKLPRRNTTWEGEELSAWKSKTHSFEAGSDGIQSVLQGKPLAMVSPNLLPNVGSLELRISLRSLDSPAAFPKQKAPRIFMEWFGKGRVTKQKAQSYPLEEGPDQVFVFAAPIAARLEDFEVRRLRARLRIIAPHHEITLHSIASKHLPPLSAMQPAKRLAKRPLR